jgi:hypothetical protein
LDYLLVKQELIKTLEKLQRDYPLRIKTDIKLYAFPNKRNSGTTSIEIEDVGIRFEICIFFDEDLEKVGVSLHHVLAHEYKHVIDISEIWKLDGDEICKDTLEAWENEIEDIMEKMDEGLLTEEEGKAEYKKIKFESEANKFADHFLVEGLKRDL